MSPRDTYRVSARIKVAAAAVGAGVMVAMGALTMAFGGTEAHAIVPTPPLDGAGDTSTQTTAATTIATPAASPTMKAPPYGKSG